MALTLRSVVNRPLTYAELDGNFTYLLGLIQTLGTLPSDLLVDGVFNLAYAPELQLQDGMTNKGTENVPILGIDFTNDTFETNIQAIAGGTPVTPVPDAPVLTAGTPTSSGVPFTWTKPANTVSFVLQRATNAGFTTGLTTVYSSTAQAFTDSGLTASTNYYFRIAGVNATGQGPWSTVVPVTTAASGGGSGLTPFASLIREPEGLSVTDTQIASNSDNNFGWAYSALQLSIGGTGIFEFECSDASAAGGIIVGLAAGANRDADSGFQYLLQATYEHKLLGGAKANQAVTGVLAVSTNTKARIVADGTNLNFIYSTDNRSTWNTVAPSAPQPSVAMLFKIFTDNSGRVLNNASYSGFTIVT